MEVLSTKEYAIILLDRGFMWIKFKFGSGQFD